MRASVCLWTKKDPREAAGDTPLVLLGQHTITGRVELGTVSRKAGAAFGRSRYWPGKPWDEQWEWIYLPSPRAVPSEYEEVLMRIHQTPGKVRP